MVNTDEILKKTLVYGRCERGEKRVKANLPFIQEAISKATENGHETHLCTRLKTFMQTPGVTDILEEGLPAALVVNDLSIRSSELIETANIAGELHHATKPWVVYMYAGTNYYAENPGIVPVKISQGNGYLTKEDIPALVEGFKQIFK